MQHSPSDGDRLLLLTLMLEVAVQADDWSQVTEFLNARASLIEVMLSAPEQVIREIGIAEERILGNLRRKLAGVKVDLRNLTAALRIASPYVRAQTPASLSLAG